MEQQLQEDLKLNAQLLQEKGASRFFSGAETLMLQHIPGLRAVHGWELCVCLFVCFFSYC